MFFSKKTPSSNTNFAFAIHALENGDFSLSKINLLDGTIDQEISLNFPVQYMTVDKDGTLYLTSTRDMGIPKHELYRLTSNGHKIKKLAKLPHPYPSTVIPYKDFLYVITGAPSSDPTHVEVLTKKGEFLKSVLINKSSMLNDGSLQVFDYKNTKKFLGISVTSLAFFYIGENCHFQENMVFKNELGIFDQDLNQIKVVTRNFLPSYSGIAAMYFIDSKKKILAFPLGVPDNPQKTSSQPNYDILSLDQKTFEISKKIPLKVPIGDAKYIPGREKIYISSGKNLVVFDAKTETILKTFYFESIIRYEYVGHDRLILSVLDTNKKNKLLILDTKTDQIIKEFSGNYGPISKQFYEE